MTEEEKALALTDSPDLASAPFTYKTLVAIAKTEFVPAPLRGKVPAILACILAGREWGLGPMEALSRIDMIDGKPSPSGELLVARVFAAGHEIYPKDLSDKSATAVGIRHLEDGTTRPQEFTFTWDMAERAGLTGKPNWKHYPEAMLYWRAASQLVRFMFPDVLSSFRAYTPDELGDGDWQPPDPGIGQDEMATVLQVVDYEQAGHEAEYEEAEPGAETADAVEVPSEPAPEPGVEVAAAELGAEVVERKPEDYEARLIDFVAEWVGDRNAAEMEVKRVVKGRVLDAKTANDLYRKLKNRLGPAETPGQAELRL